VLEANLKVPMIVACHAIGMKVDEGSTKKMYCPFGEFSHLDGGDEPAFRVYSDHAFCFACWKWYSPVGLCVAEWEVTEDSAAETLMRLAGVAPESYQEVWDRVTEEVTVDTRAVGDALEIYCARNFPRWERLKYTDEVALYLARCRGLLVQVKSESEARQWLEGCSRVMDTVLRRADAEA
jgi:hypothetical protein